MLSARKNRNPHAKLVLAIDIGTTFTAASYCMFIKDNDPFFQEVNRWPKQVTADAKIPSVLYYDNLGVARLHGAETEDEESLVEAEQHNWKKAEWWKLLLRPAYLAMPNDFSPTVLPAGITVDNIFRDQLAYVLYNVHEFIAKAHNNSDKYWEELASSMFVILTTPNGWEGRHQNQMREAAIKAGLVGPDQRNRVRFVSEGEAAIHYALDCPNINHSVAIGSIVLVCDAGGGTTDVGVYKVNSLSPINLEEISSPRCFVAGGVFVNACAEKFIAKQLRGSKWGTPEYVASAVRTFERQVKRSFKGSEIYSFLKLDPSTANDEAHGVIRGRLRISRADIISFFEPSIQTIIGGLEEILGADELIPDQIFLVGGFAESEYVYSEITRWAEAHQLPIAKPDGVLSKAIAHGALSWHLHSGVQVRIAKLHYGAEINLEFDPRNPGMVGRYKYQNVRGQWRVRHAWKTIVQKNARLRPGEEYTSWFHLDFSESDDKTVEMELYAYRFADPPYEVCLSFDEIEIKACLRWRENGVQVVGEATISYDF